MTTFDPGARVVFTQGFRLSPLSTARLARRPAPIITLGLEVLVQEVIDAITTSPCLMV
jgi:hypothetical protein